MIKCEDLEKCFSESSDKNKTLKDKKGGSSKFQIVNNSREIFQIIDFENCVYKNLETETKCDFGLLTNQEIIYIELKGSDVKKGILQLNSTIGETKKCFENLKLKGRLIVSRFPKPDLVKQTKDYKDLMKIVNQDLIITQNIHIENI